MNYNISEIATVIRNRRTIKPENFSERQVPREIIEELLDSARWAPTHGMTEPWFFKIYYNKGLTQFSTFHAETYKALTPPERFAEKKYHKMKERPLRASALIAICMKRGHNENIPDVEEIASVACAVHNMCLLGTAHGLALYWGSGGLTYTEEMKRFLGLRKQDKCLGFLYIGYPAIEWPKGIRKSVEHYTDWVNK